MQVIFKCSSCQYEDVDIFSVCEVKDKKNLIKIDFICRNCGEGDTIPEYLYKEEEE